MSETVKPGDGSSKNIHGDPPQININLPKRSELTNTTKRWKEVQLPVDILLLTVKDCEFLSCHYFLANPFRSYYKGLGHVYFGGISEGEDVELKVALMKCSEGSKGPGGSLTVVKNAVTQLRPKAVFSVGHCSGLSQGTTKLGDVVVSEKLTTYAYQKVMKDGVEFCGVVTPVSRDIADLIKYAGYGWNPPLENPKEQQLQVHCGEILSGPELVQAEWRRDKLVDQFPGAIAIETEGEGVYAAARDLKLEWVVIKGISGYADGTEVAENWETFASLMAASVVVHILNDCSIFEDWPHYQVEKRRLSSESQDQGNKRMKLEDFATEQFLERCQNQLRKFYNTRSQVKITPWDPNKTVHINDIYIQLSVLQDNTKPDGTTKEKLTDYSELLGGDELHPNRNRILVYGRPGIGKSTFSQKLAVDWARVEKEILKKFSVLLLIRLRDVCDSPDFCAMLKRAELLSADDPMAVSKLFEYVRQNQEKVLLVLDGYDEYTVGKSSPVHQIWRGNELSECCVIITTRPEIVADELRPLSHAQFEINGFDSWEQIEQFASKLLPDKKDVKELLDYLEKHDLRDLAEIPLLLLMLCLLWKEKVRQGLPTSRAYIYVGFIETLLYHLAAKDSDKGITERSIDNYEKELSSIGKLAFDALLEDCYHFDASKYPCGDVLEKLVKVGFFQVSYLSSWTPRKIVHFLHKSVQEFLAAWFIVQELTVKENETVTCLSGIDTYEKVNKTIEVLKFVCELSSEAASALSNHLHYIGEKEGLTKYHFTKTPSINDLSGHQRYFIYFSVDCLFSCPASDRQAVYPSFLSCVNHVVTLHEGHWSTAAKEHFFKSTSSIPSYVFLDNLFKVYDQTVDEDVLSIMRDLNVVLLTCSGEIKAVKGYDELKICDFFLKKEEKGIFFFLARITDDVLHSELLTELTSAPVCSPRTAVDNLAKNEDNSSALCLAENRSEQTRQHCLSLVSEIVIKDPTSEDLLKNILPLLTALQRITIMSSDEEDQLTSDEEDQLIEKGACGELMETITDMLCGVNFTDNLHSLRLRDINLTAKCAAIIAESLHQAPNLQSLKLSKNPLYSGVSDLAENLYHVPQLTELWLDDVHMGDKECAALAASLQDVNKLEELMISNNPLGHGIIELAENLHSLPNLLKLSLNNTNMCEEEVSALARALKDVPELRTVYLAANPLGRGVSDLIQHLSSVPKLWYLYLIGVQITKKEAEELCTAVRKSNIIILSTDYHEVKSRRANESCRLLTEAELKERGVEFDDDDDDEDDDSDDDDAIGDANDDEDDDSDDDDAIGDANDDEDDDSDDDDAIGDANDDEDDDSDDDDAVGDGVGVKDDDLQMS